MRIRRGLLTADMEPKRPRRNPRVDAYLRGHTDSNPPEPSERKTIGTGRPTRAWVISVLDDEPREPAARRPVDEERAWRLFLEYPDDPQRNNNHEGALADIRRLIAEAAPSDVYLWSAVERTYVKVPDWSSALPG
jgi:hypothetical protein